MSNPTSTEETSIEDLMWLAEKGERLEDDEQARVDAYRAENPDPTDGPSDHVDANPVDPDGSGDESDPDQGETLDDDGSDESTPKLTRQQRRDDERRRAKQKAHIGPKTTSEAATDYRSRGGRPIPLDKGEKKPSDTGWADPGYVGRVGDDQNIGLALWRLLDADLDSDEAVQLVSHYLQPTGWVFGRESKPESHFIYEADEPEGAPPLRRVRYIDPIDATTMYLEVRGEGHQTMVPPSIHPSGEKVEWSKYDDPAKVTVAQLLTTAGELATASMLLRHWPEWSNRLDFLTIHLAGGLLRTGWDTKRVCAFLRPILDAAGDPDPEDRLGAVESAAEKIAGGDETTGFAALAEIIDPKIVKTIMTWLGVETPTTGFGNARQDRDRDGRLQAAAGLLGEKLATMAGARHDFTMALSGGAATDGVDQALLEQIVSAACRAVPDADETDLLNTVSSSYSKVEAGIDVTGWGTACAMADADWIKGFKASLAAAADTRVMIPFLDGNLNRQSDRALAALVAANDPETLFRRIDGSPGRMEADADGRPHVAPISAEGLRWHLGRVACFQKPVKTELVEVPVPRDVCLNILARPVLPLPWIDGIATAPIFGPDFTLRQRPGYHPSARTWVHLDGLTLPPISPDPSAAEIAASVDIFRELLADFPFVSDADFAHALALAVQPFGRPLIAGSTPIYVIEKPTPGTGGTLLSQVLTSPFTGPGGAIPTVQPEDDAEMKKLFVSKAGRGDPFLLIDNLRGPLDSGVLASALTSGQVEGRLLGTNQTVNVKTLWTTILTANNPVLSTENARRSARIRLDAKSDRPFNRTGFRHPLPAWSDENRGRLVQAALTFWYAWKQEGRPAGKATLGGFEAWSETMGGILQVVGVPGFLDNAQDFYEAADVEGAAWRSLVEAWWDVFGSTDVTAAELFRLPAASEGLTYKTDRPDLMKAAFGRMLGVQRDRWYGPLKVHHAGTNRSKVQVYSLVHRDGETKERQPAPTVTDFGPRFDAGDVIRTTTFGRPRA